jgi:elongation factor G
MEAFTKIKFIETYKKQSGGRGKFGDIVFRSQPHEVEKFQKDYNNAVKGGNVPKEYIPSVEKGFAMNAGPLAGYQVDSLTDFDLFTCRF